MLSRKVKAGMILSLPSVQPYIGECIRSSLGTQRLKLKPLDVPRNSPPVSKIAPKNRMRKKSAPPYFNRLSQIDRNRGALTGPAQAYGSD